MLQKIFSQEGLLWKGLNILTDILFLSVIWFLLCLPVIPIGPATTALYDAVVHGIRRREPVVYPRFLETFKREFKTAFFSSLLWGGLILICVLTVRYLLSLGETSRSAFAAGIAYYIVLIIPLGSACWVFPILSRFTFDFKSLNKTAFRFALAYLPRTLILVLLTIEVLQWSLNYLFPFAFMPAVTMLLWSLFIEPVFKKYEPAVTDDAGDNLVEN
ncbi:MAG: YesL family protein [Anaerolineaceae bacterium]|nr:YesL family protein [Anaerolineaceae bacterium]